MIEEHIYHFLTGLSFSFFLPILLLLSPGYWHSPSPRKKRIELVVWGKSKIVFCMWHCCCIFTTSGWQKLISTHWRLPQGTSPPQHMGNRKSNSSLINQRLLCVLASCQKTILKILAPFQYGYMSSVLILLRFAIFFSVSLCVASSENNKQKLFCINYFSATSSKSDWSNHLMP